MSKLIIQVEDFDSGLKRFRRAWENSEEQGEYLTFATVEAMLKTLTSRRWELLKILQAEGPMSLRALARRLGRDVKSVHRDVTALKALGLIEDCAQGIRVPYDEIEAHLTLKAAA